MKKKKKKKSKQEHDTPFFVMDAVKLREQMEQMEQISSKSRIRM